MQRNQKTVSAGGMIILVFIMINAIIFEHGYKNHAEVYKLAYITLPLLVISIMAFRRKLL